MAGPLGGARPGAGRPRKSVKFGPQIAKAEKQIADRLPQLLDRALELAAGISVQVEDKNGVKKIYTKPPDLEAIKYLVDRIMGKPVTKAAAEANSQSGGAVRITEMVIVHEEDEEDEVAA